MHYLSIVNNEDRKIKFDQNRNHAPLRELDGCDHFQTSLISFIRISLLKDKKKKIVKAKKVGIFLY